MIDSPPAPWVRAFYTTKLENSFDLNFSFGPELAARSVRILKRLPEGSAIAQRVFPHASNEFQRRLQDAGLIETQRLP
jgi:hypothetical protein